MERRVSVGHRRRQMLTSNKDEANKIKSSQVCYTNNLLLLKLSKKMSGAMNLKPLIQLCPIARKLAMLKERDDGVPLSDQNIVSSTISRVL